MEQAERWRHRGWRVGFTNGYLRPAAPGPYRTCWSRRRASCDRLIVGLNSDTSVRRQKGPPHPVQPEAARAAVLASFACVDQVCLFEEDSPEALIEALRPDVLIKGANHALEDVVGAYLVRGWGGRVLQIDLLQEQLPQAGHGDAEA